MYLRKRQFVHSDSDTPINHENHDGMEVWYSPTAYVVKWSVLLSIFITFFLWITIGYYHARQRLKRGLPPLAYHRWLVPKSQRYPQPRLQNNYEYYQQAHPGVHDGVDPPPGKPLRDQVQFSNCWYLVAYTKDDMPPTYQPSKAKVESTARPIPAQTLPLSISEGRNRTGSWGFGSFIGHRQYFEINSSRVAGFHHNRQAIDMLDPGGTTANKVWVGGRHARGRWLIWDSWNDISSGIHGIFVVLGSVESIIENMMCGTRSCWDQGWWLFWPFRYWQTLVLPSSLSGLQDCSSNTIFAFGNW